jgi:hypothetical protein
MAALVAEGNEGKDFPPAGKATSEVFELDVGRSRLGVILPKRSGIDMVDEGQSMAPLGLIGEAFW